MGWVGLSMSLDLLDLLAGIYLEKKQTSVFMTGGSGVSRVKAPSEVTLYHLTSTGGESKNFPLHVCFS